MNFWHGARTKYQFFAFFISPMDFTNQKPLSRGQGEKNYNLLRHPDLGGLGVGHPFGTRTKAAKQKL